MVFAPPCMAGNSPSIEPTRAFWIGTTLVAAVVVVAGSLCWRLPVPPPKATAVPGVRIGHARLDANSGNRVLREEALLRDPTPLFLPTRWSAAAAVRPESVLREPGETWGGFPPQLVFPPDNAHVALPLPSRPPETPIEALRAERWDRPFLGWGQRDGAWPALPSRRAFIEVVSLRDGRTLLAEPLDAAPAAGQDWNPIQWMAAVEAAGPVGAPALLQGSGQEQVDRFYSDFLEKQWRLGERLARLAPGFYHIILGP